MTNDTQGAQILQIAKPPALIHCHYVICMATNMETIAVIAVQALIAGHYVMQSYSRLKADRCQQMLADVDCRA